MIFGQKLPTMTNRKELTDDILNMLSVINPSHDKVAVYKHLCQLSDKRLREEYDKVIKIWTKWKRKEQ